MNRIRGRRGFFRGRGRGALASRSRLVTKSQAHTAHNGREYRPNADPPSVVTIPWNSAVVTLGVPLTATPWDTGIDFSAIVAQLRAQLGLPAFDIVARISRIAIWELTGAPISLIVYDLQNPGEWYQTQIEDNPGRNRWARCGYIYSAADQSYVVNSSSDTGKEVFRVKGRQASSVVAYVHLLWRSATYTSPDIQIPSLSTQVDRVVAAISTLSVVPSLE